MVDTPEMIGLVKSPFGWRLWNRDEDAPEDATVRYVRADLQAAHPGWRPIDSAPTTGDVLLDLGETIPDSIDARVGSFISELDARELGETLSASGGWLIWNSGKYGCDFFVIPFHEANNWMPLPQPPAEGER